MSCQPFLGKGYKICSKRENFGRLREWLVRLTLASTFTSNIIENLLDDINPFVSDQTGVTITAVRRSTPSTTTE